MPNSNYLLYPLEWNPWFPAARGRHRQGPHSRQAVGNDERDRAEVDFSPPFSIRVSIV
jgi:hypothetical protein